MSFVEDQVFEHVSFHADQIVGKSFECCKFIQCDFNRAKLDRIKFVDCEFEECNFSNASLVETVLQQCLFFKCKMVGINFSYAQSFLFGVQCESSDLSLCYFENNDLTRSRFLDCKLDEAQFISVNAEKTVFDQSCFNGTIFEDCQLSKSSFVAVEAIVIRPDANRIKGMIFSKENLSGLLTEHQLKIVD